MIEKAASTQKKTDRNDLKAIADALGGHFSDKPETAATGADAKKRGMGGHEKPGGKARKPSGRRT